MASFEAGGLDDLIRSMEDLSKVPEQVQDQILDAQADVVVTAQKRTGFAYGVRRTGQTVGSIKKGRPKVRKGVRQIYVIAAGTNRKGQRNAEVAFLQNYGVPRRKQKKRPFISHANETSAKAATEAGAEVFYKWQESLDL